MPFLCEEDIMSKLKAAANITVSEPNDDLMQPTYKDQQPLAIIQDESNEKINLNIGLYLSMLNKMKTILGLIILKGQENQI